MRRPAAAPSNQAGLRTDRPEVGVGRSLPRLASSRRAYDLASSTLGTDRRLPDDFGAGGGSKAMNRFVGP